MPQARAVFYETTRPEQVLQENATDYKSYTCDRVALAGNSLQSLLDIPDRLVCVLEKNSVDAQFTSSGNMRREVVEEHDLFRLHAKALAR